MKMLAGLISQWFAGDTFLQGRALVTGHGQEQPSVGGLVDLVDAADVGVIQGGSGLGLMNEASLGFGVVGELGRQELEGHGALELEVPSPVDHPHAPLAELPVDPVMRYGLADHAANRAAGNGVARSSPWGA
jgi:hypothetical protein